MSERGYLTAALGLILSAFIFQLMAPWVFLSLIIMSVCLLIMIKKDGITGLIFLLIVFLAIGSLRFSSEINDVRSLADKNIYTYKIKGRVNSQPKKNNGKSYFFLKVKTINEKPVDGYLWVGSKKKVKVVYGDELTFTGNIVKPSQEVFADYLLRKRVKDTCNVIKVSKIEKTILSPVGEMQEKIESYFSKSDDSEALLLASFIGNTSTLSEEAKSNFKTSGLAHLWSVSGLHVGCLILFILFLTRMAGLKPLAQLFTASVTLIVYSLLAALSPPVVRSAIMGFIVLLGWCCGRKKDLLSILLLSFIIMVIYDPLMIYDAGFQLSFASVFGILLMASKIESFFWDWPGFLKTSVAVSLAAQIVTTPFLAYHFGSIPVYSVIANILAVPLIMPMMVLIFCYVLFHGFWGALVLKIMAKLPAKAILAIAAYVSKLPFSRLFMQKPLIIVIILITGLAGAFLINKHKISFATALILATAVILAGCTIQTVNKPTGFNVQYFDVGQGDSSLVTNGNNRILIDGGPEYDSVADKLSSEGINSLDVVILSHPHADHLTGLIRVIKNFKVGLFINSGYKYPSYLYKDLLTEIRDRKIKYLEPKAGKSFILGKIKLTILNPPVQPVSGTDADVDNNSVVCRIESSGVSVLFTGDIHKETEELILKNYKSSLCVDVLKVAHHGSAYSSMGDFLSAVKPKYSVISVGADNPYGHPTASALGRLRRAGSKIYRTDRNGVVTMNSVEDGFKVDSEK
jgi:competence protein ComEC